MTHALAEAAKNSRNAMGRKAWKPKPGQIDYTNIRRAPVLNSVVHYGNKILLVKRSSNLRLYPNYWNGISGFLDDEKSIPEKAKSELKEETGIGEKDVVSLKEGTVFELDASEYDKTWIVHPVLIDVKTDNVKLNWEAEDYKWVTLEEAYELDLLPGFDMVLKTFL